MKLFRMIINNIYSYDKKIILDFYRSNKVALMLNKSLNFSTIKEFNGVINM